jgi:hypothetical protein
MKSSTTPDFWERYSRLSPETRGRARNAYRLWKKNPRHPSLCFKKVGQVWSIRIGGGYRAIALLEGDVFFWFWVGSHDEYEKLLATWRGKHAV